MAKYRPQQKQHETGQTITTKSRYGSHADMVVEPQEVEPNNGLCLDNIHHSEVICKDDRGYYITLKARLDNGLADPNRYSNSRQ